MTLDTLLSIVQAPFCALGLFFGTYILVLTVAALSYRRSPAAGAPSRRRFAIVIPAHNEEKVIGRTLMSTAQLVYPRELLDVVVVADNCTDATADIARAHGALVYERSDEHHRGKGYALNWIAPLLLEHSPPYDAHVILDADSAISPNFLEEMNGSLEQGHTVIQSADLVAENRDSWRVQLVSIAFILQNFFRPLGKSSLGLFIALKGNGMCFRSDLLRTVRWDVSSLCEDLDLAVDLLRGGVLVHFNPEAVVHAIMPDAARGATTQRMRWEGGKFASMRSSVPSLLSESFRRRSLRLFEAAVDISFPPLVLFLLIALAFVCLNALVLWLGWLTSYFFLTAWILVITSILLHCAAGLIRARVSPVKLLALLHVPGFMLWKISVYVRILRKKGPKDWVRTAR